VNLPGSELVKKFHKLYGKLKFITAVSIQQDVAIGFGVPYYCVLETK
jgi:hypothetical protein